MADIVISSGHAKYVRGASGYLDEVDEARRVVEEVARKLRFVGIEVDTFHDNTSETQDENLAAIVDYHNSKERDLDVSIHFNAYEDTPDPMGTECLYLTQDALAANVAYSISIAGSLINRGAKQNSNLYFLNNTDQPAILVEVCFVDSQEDSELYEHSFHSICTAIAIALVM